VFRGDYLASFGLDRICEELEAVTALARFGPADGELLAVALLEDEAGHKLRLHPDGTAL
jgi:3-hydroxyisobutyrate dehydrogenase